MKNTDSPKEGRDGFRLLAGFQKFARTIARTSGHPLAFVLALGTIAIWALAGPLFRFGNTWLLVINTVANLITFLMIFLIRSSQNRESEAVLLKLDELIRSTNAAQNTLLDIEELSEEELDRIKARFGQLARKARDEPVAIHPESIHPDDQNMAIKAKSAAGD